MAKQRILIIGAGPAGLAAAYELSKKGKDIEVDIFEAEPEVGGLSKTISLDGYYFDLGGHRFFTNIEDVKKVWHEVLGKDFISQKRISRIYYKNKFFDYPIKISNVLMNLGVLESSLIFFSFLKSKIRPFKKEDNFEDWVTNRFGKKLYRTFFKTYTEKVWGMPCKEISSEWASQRIKGLSLLSALLNALPLKRKKDIKTLTKSFYYPKYGPGMMYEKIKDLIEKKHNFSVHTNLAVKKIFQKGRKWQIHTDKGAEQKKYDHIISTMPLTDLISVLNLKRDTKKIKSIARDLRYRDFIIVCLVFKNKNTLKDTWIYMHEKKVRLGRLQVLNNWGKHMLKNKNYASYGAEYFCTEGDKIWQMNDQKLASLAINEMKKCNIIPSDFKKIKSKVVRVKKAYPVYDSYYSKNIKKIQSFIDSVENLQTCGRYGMFRYNNMDHSIYTGMLAAKNILSGKKKYNLWGVNQDEVYCEK